MNWFFNTEGKLNEYIRTVIDVIYLNLLWLLSCLPLFTIGAASTALFDAVRRSIISGENYAHKVYFRSFMENFKQATVLWCGVLAGIGILVIDGVFLIQMAQGGSGFAKLLLVLLAQIAVLLFLWVSCLFPYISRFSIGNKGAVKNSMLIMLADSGRFLLLIPVFAVHGLLLLLLPPLIFVLPVVTASAANGS